MRANAFDQLIQQWRTEAETLRGRYSTPSLAAAFEACAADLEKVLKEHLEGTVSLTDAAALSGYSADHLGRLIRDGRLANYGTKPRPKLRRSELPNKPAALLSTDVRPLTLSRTQIVAAIAQEN